MARHYIEYMRLDTIRRDPANEKMHSDADIRRSIENLNVIESMTYDDRTDQLIAGHGRLDAYRWLHQAGRPRPDGLDVDPEDGMWLAPVERGWESRSDDEAAAGRTGLNWIAHKGGYAERDLLETWNRLDEVGLLLTAGVTENERELLERRVDPPPPDEEPPPDRKPNRDPQLISCPNCGEEFEK